MCFPFICTKVSESLVQLFIRHNYCLRITATKGPNIMSDPDTNLSGRARHLAALKSVFEGTGEPCVYLAVFLKFLFGDITFSSIRRREVPQLIQCRHAMMDQAFAASPCVAMGTWDRNKNPGLVVYDLCLSAMEFLRSLGKEVAQDEQHVRFGCAVGKRQCLT